MEKHLTLVSIFQIVLGIVGILFGLAILVILSTIAVFVGEKETFFILPIIGAVVGGLFIFGSVFGLIGGIALLKRKQWSRILLLIVSVLNLFNLPIGTALGVYTIWVLMQDESISLLENTTTAI